jgi:hypothetical protein
MTVPTRRTARIVPRAKDVKVARSPRFTVASVLQNAFAITVSLENRIANVPGNSSALVVTRDGRKAAKSVKAYLRNVTSQTVS